ncbi:MAG: type II toxin-antitoxin system prevent-host-death family antitoxin [Chloroflexota bacterium]
MDDRTIMASRFKAECLAILDQVDEMKVSFTITKHGRPVAKLVPADADDYGAELAGSVTLIAEDDEDYFSTGEVWDAERGIL